MLVRIGVCVYVCIHMCAFMYGGQRSDLGVVLQEESSTHLRQDLTRPGACRLRMLSETSSHTSKTMAVLIAMLFTVHIKFLLL